MSEKVIVCPRKKCGHPWKPRKENPLSCPRCRQYLKVVK